MTNEPKLMATQLRQAISNVVYKICGNHVISNQKEMMTESLVNFILDSVSKFAAGQKEHGGSITERNLSEETRKEIIDLFWYQSALKWPKPENGQYDKYEGDCKRHD